MKFRCVPLPQARGHILGHNVTRDGRRVLKKGRRLGDAELAQIAEAGADSVYVAELEPDDVEEDAAALRVARALAAAGKLRERAAYGGRVSLLSPSRGVWSVRPDLLLELNQIEGVTLATLPSHAVVSEGQTCATLKIIPFALPEQRVARAETLAARGVAGVAPLAPRRVCVLVSGAAARRKTLVDTFGSPLTQRFEALGTTDVQIDFVSLEHGSEAALSSALDARIRAGVDLVVLVSETATMDADDLAPRAIRRASGEVAVVGAPVFPGNLLLLGYRGATAILGAPGCVRSRGRNVVDLLLPRLLAGERLGPRDVAELGLGGLLAGADEGGE